MKLETTIAPRRDGTVSVELAGQKIVFAQDEQGRLVADVAEESSIAYLLGLADFMPADEEDFEAASKIAARVAVKDEDEADDSEDDDVPMAPPVEENTPPSRKKPRKAA